MRTYSPNKLSRQLRPLEDRWCPSCTITVSGTTLRIVGDDGANVVTVSHDGTGNVVATGDGTTRTAAGISRIVIDLKKGDDSAAAQVTGELTSPLEVRLNLGDGNDTAALKFAAVAADLSVSADLGAGDDRITDLNLDEEIRTGAAVKVDIRGRDGADGILLSVNEVRPDAELEARFDGGAGDDSFEARLGDPIEAGARVKVQSDGGAGNDSLVIDGTNYCLGPSVAPGAVLDVGLKGGAGDDVAALEFEEIGGVLAVDANLGAGNDRIDINLDKELRTGAEAYLDVRGRDGADTVVLSANEVREGAQLRSWFDGAAGNDSFTAFLGDSIDAGAFVKLVADGGQGDDALTVDATTYGVGGGVAAGAELIVRFNGGRGNDAIRVTYEGDVDGQLELQLDAGRGDDTVTADVSVSAGSTGAALAWVNGGDGDDALTLLLQDLSAGAAAVEGGIEGGTGIDAAVATPNVAVGNCET